MLPIKFLYILTFILLFSSRIGVDAATISSPREGSVYKDGDKFTVKVDLEQTENVEMIWLFTTDGKNSVVLKSSPYEAEFKVDTKYIGEDKVHASIKYMDGRLIDLEKNIKIVLPDGVILQSITNANNHAYVHDTDSTGDIGSLYGMYSDGIERKLPNIADPTLEYSSDDPTIVEVDNSGKLYSKKLGKTFITIKSGDVSSKLPVKVYVTLEPPKNFKAVATQTEIQLSWELSPNDPKWVTGYQVWRGLYANESQDVLIAALPKGTTLYVDSSVNPDTTYYYTVLAISDVLNDISSMNPKQTGKLLAAP